MSAYLSPFQSASDQMSRVLQSKRRPSTSRDRRPRFFDDNRYRFDQAGWPDNMMASSRHLRTLGCGRQFWLTHRATPYDRAWMLSRMVYGTLFGIPRTLMTRIGGFDERFQGWGWEDTWLGARAISEGAWVVPVPGATGYHLAHPDRSPTQWQEAKQNQKLYEWLVGFSAVDVTTEWFTLAEKRIERGGQMIGHPSLTDISAADRVSKSIETFLSQPRNSAIYYTSLGQWERTLASLEDAPIQCADAASYARALFELGEVGAGADYLKSARKKWQDCAR